MTRNPECERFVDVAIGVRELDVEVVDGRAERQLPRSSRKRERDVLARVIAAADGDHDELAAVE